MIRRTFLSLLISGPASNALRSNQLAQGGGNAGKAPYPQLEKGAVSLDLGNDKSFEELADSVLSLKFSSRWPAKEETKHRLAMAEKAYLQGHRPAVSEADLSNAYNRVIKALDAPSFALTTPSQFHTLRSMATRHNPIFLKPRARSNSDPTIDSPGMDLSPLQAVYLGFHMFDQKRFSVLFQCDLDEWEKTCKNAILQRAADAEGQSGKIYARQSFGDADGKKTEELRRRVARRVAEMGAAKQVKLMESVLESFGA